LVVEWSHTDIFPSAMAAPAAAAMAAPAAAATTAATEANPPPPSLLCLPPELLTAVAAHLWATGHGAAWSALSRTCAVAHGACLDAVRRVELPPVTPDGRGAQEQPLGGVWRTTLEFDRRRFFLLGAHYVISEATRIKVANLVPLTAQMLVDREPGVCRSKGRIRDPALGPTTHDSAVADELVRSVAAFLGHFTGGAGRDGSGGRLLRAARLGRIYHTGQLDILPYSPANADVLGRLLPPLASCPLDAFAADGWAIRLLGQGGARLSAGRLRTLRLRRATAGDGPTHWAIASVLRTHAAELEEVVVGLSAEPVHRSALGDADECSHHVTGYLSYWLGAAVASPLPPPLLIPAPWGSGGPAPPVQLPHLRVLSFLGSVDAADMAALVAAAPRLSTLSLHGAVGRGALKGLALPAVPELNHLELHTAIEVAPLHLELPVALAGRPPLDVLRLPADICDSTAAGGWVWGSGELWGGRGSPVAVPCELVASTTNATPWTYDDATVKLVCGQGTSQSISADVAGGVGPVPTASDTAAAAGVLGWTPATGLRSLTIALGPTATDAAVVSLAALPALITLRLVFTKATNVRLSSWPAFPALTRLALVLATDPASCGVSAAAAVAALSAPPSAAPVALVALRFVTFGSSNDALLPADLPDDEVGGWESPPPDLSPLASWAGLRSLTWESLTPIGRAHRVFSPDLSAAEEARMAATARRVAASLPRVTTTLCTLGDDDSWGPEGRHKSGAYFSHPAGGNPDGSVGAQGV